MQYLYILFVYQERENVFIIISKSELQKLISNSWGKHKANQYHDSDVIPDKTYWILMNIGFYIKLSS